MKVGAIIQARFRSTRLPGKVLMPLPFPYGKPLLKHIVDAIRLSNKIHYSCIATSSLAENNAIEEFANQQGIHCFRGSEDDVLSRFISITKKEELDVVIRLTGDNPLVAFMQLEEALQYHFESKNDYTKTSGLPVGMNFEIVAGNTLIELANKSCSDEDKEHVTKFINENDGYKKSIYSFSYPQISNLRCTIDYPSDYAMFNLLFQKLKFIDIVDELAHTNQQFPWMFAVNNSNFQIKTYKNVFTELEEAKIILAKHGMHTAVKRLTDSKA